LYEAVKNYIKKHFSSTFVSYLVQLLMVPWQYLVKKQTTTTTTTKTKKPRDFYN